jgi:hypothetical protein
MVAKIEELKGKEETVTELKLATALISFERVVDLACKNARPNMRWRQALAHDWSASGKRIKLDVLYQINHLQW